MLTTEVINAIKRAFSRSAFARKFKNGKVLKQIVGPRGGKMVSCESCKKSVSYSKSEIDHISPCCPVMLSQKVMSFSMLFSRTFCDDENLQLLCPDCHKVKSKVEMAERVKWRRKKKYLVVRHKDGSRMEVLPLINLKELPVHWEVMFVSAGRKEADAELKRRKKL